ncbi:enolase C-terminal domain-like protein [Polyangium sp. y55x31]|uniref:enolase C-terminal domain-like protein n=1 Tax=Polyangium sp. y55x31 TaxID=3042688 RepID=UPI002482DCF5|nr:enolase C-terminal domain-like protein [Polyangium sp. y55x31]MDI1480278.1 enolase C-terminal domain-like protein [Polyangium sp. y55x31]
MQARSGAAIEQVSVSAYRIPTDRPESDGTLEWDHTILVVVEVQGGGRSGLGYTYADTATARLIHDKLAPLVTGMDAFAVTAAHDTMVHAVRNLGSRGIASMAISAVDVALWDLKARLCDLSLVRLLGAVRDAVPIYGSGGFTSYSTDELQQQLVGYRRDGMTMVKMKVGRDPAADPARVRSAREAIGPDVALFVDANGAYDRKQALAMAEVFAEFGVRWFEEPVSSDDLRGLRLLRDRAPAIMDIAAGEYGYDTFYFRHMLASGSVDVLQADATRCRGITGLMRAAALCDAFSIPLSTHTAPALHVHPSCALSPIRHLEYFHDHVRIESMLFDGCPVPRQGELRPDPERPGLGLELRRADAARFAVGGG